MCQKQAFRDSVELKEGHKARMIDATMMAVRSGNKRRQDSIDAGVPRARRHTRQQIKILRLRHGGS